MASMIPISKALHAISPRPKKGGIKGWVGVAEEVSNISLACRQMGPIRFKEKMKQGEYMFQKRRSLFFKKMQIVRGFFYKAYH